MSRLPRLAIAGLPHLVLQRGAAGQAVFRDDQDRLDFLARLSESSAAHRVAVHAYILLDDEVQLVATPGDAGSLSRMMQSLGRTYVAHFNRRHQRGGTLWQGRFRATVFEPERYLISAMRLVEGRALTTGVLDAVDYPWSSAGHHVGRQSSSLVTDHPVFWGLGNTPFDREARYRELLAQPLPAREVNDLEQAVAKGWALGSASFVRELTQSTSRRLQPLPRGRPKGPRSSSDQKKVRI